MFDLYIQLLILATAVKGAIHIHILSILVLLGLLRGKLLIMFFLEVLFAELHQVRRVVSDHLLRELLQDLGEVLRHVDLVGTEDSHLSHVCHLIKGLFYKL